MENKEEVWKDIVGYKGLYQVSNYGNVKSLDRKVNWRKNFKQKIKGKQKKLRFDSKKRYLLVDLSSKRGTKTLLVHRLVAIAFIPNPKNKPQVNHKDGIKWHNFETNLEWATDSENKIHAWNTGLSKITNNKSIIQVDLDGNDVEIFETISSAAIKMKVCISSISNALLGYSKTSSGYKWKYK